MPAFGLDIGTTSIKLVELTGKPGRWTLHRLGIIPNPIGISVPIGRQQSLDLAAVIKKLVNSVKTKQTKVKVCLPEAFAYTRVITLPMMSRSELASAVNWEAEEHIPIPIDQVQIDWSVISTPPKGTKEGQIMILLVAAKKDAVNQIISLIDQTGLELTAVETVLVAAARNLFKPSDPPSLLLQLGASSSDFSVVVSGEIRLTHSIPVAGRALTLALSQSLNLSVPQAENFKRSYGLQSNLLEGKIRNAILPVLRAIMTEARKVINSFESQPQGMKVTRAVISGGTALLPRIISEATSLLGIAEIDLADPFTDMETAENVIIPAERAIYACAAGLVQTE